MIFDALSDTGQVRESNQDFVFASAAPVGNLANLFLVADGMGGHLAGEYASAHAVEIVTETIRRSRLTEPIALLEEAICTANRAIYSESMKDPSKHGMGTTFVAATIAGQHLYVANVGDSRLYLADDTAICQITRDHSFVNEMIRQGGMTVEMARHSARKNIITRAVGAESEVQIDFFDLFLQPGQQILMCTDGLTNMVPDEEILDIMRQCPDPSAVVKQLVDLANENGGRDNISAVVVRPFEDGNDNENSDPV